MVLSPLHLAFKTLRPCNFIGSIKNKKRISNKKKFINKIKPCQFHFQSAHSMNITIILQLILIHFILEIEIHDLCVNACHNDIQDAVVHNMLKICQCWNALQSIRMSLIINYHGHHNIIMKSTDTLAHLINKIC